MRHAGKLTAAAAIASGALALFSPQLSELLTRWEGSTNVVYADKLAQGLPTVCRGLTRHTVDEPIIVGDYWSDEKCLSIEKQVVSGVQLSLAECLPPDVTQGEFDALSDMSHNVGVPNVCASRAVGLMWDGRHREGCKATANAPSGKPVWSYVTDDSGAHRFVPGLYARRQDEVKVCLSGLS